MPGMMDTILNLGLNDKTVVGLHTKTGNERFAYDSYRRFIQMFGDIVMGVPHAEFEKVLQGVKDKAGVKDDPQLTTENLKEVITGYKKLITEKKGHAFPQDVQEQLKEAIHAVFGSWNNPRAITYRNINDIPHTWGTAVNIVAMVFGNMGNDSGTGVAFTRNPINGEHKVYGEYLLNAQGEDVVAGIRNTEKLETMKNVMENVYNQFMDITKKLENHYRDMQDVEFTIEHGKLWMLQTRNGKRTADSAVKIAVQMVNEGLITKEEAVKRVTTKQIDALLHPQFDPAALKKAKVLTSGVNASPGAAIGQIYFDADKVVEMHNDYKQDCIMVRPFTKPDDVHGMLSANGILTSEGGATSHAAVVARQFGVPCVVGASSAVIDMEKKTLTCGDVVLKEGDWISVDGTTGKAYEGKIAVVTPNIEVMPELNTLLTWADEIADLQVWANSDYPRAPAPSAPRVSASAAPSTCSSKPNVCRSSSA